MKPARKTIVYLTFLVLKLIKFNRVKWRIRYMHTWFDILVLLQIYVVAINCSPQTSDPHSDEVL